MIKVSDYIETKPDVRSGKAVFKSTRITVADVMELLAAGQTEAEILEDFPKLKHEHLLAAYEYISFQIS